MLKCLIFIFIFFFANQLHGTVVTTLEVSCLIETDNCDSYEKQFTFLIGNSQAEVNHKIRLLFSNLVFDYFKYEIDKDNKLKIIVSPKKRIRNIYLTSNVNLSVADLIAGLNIRSGDYKDESKIQTAKDNILRFFNEKGYIAHEVKLNQEIYNEEIDFHFRVKVEKSIFLKKIFIETDIERIKKRLEFKFEKYLNKPWDKLKFRLEFDNYVETLVGNGYFYAKNFLEMKTLPDGDGIVHIKIQHGPQLQFDFRGNEILARSEILEVLKQGIENSLGEHLKADEILDLVKKQYEKMGFYESEIRIREERGVNLYKEDYHNFFIQIKEGEKIKVKEMNFHGNIFISKKEINDLYDEHATTLAYNNFYDQNFLIQFSKILKQYYLEKGFILADISDPKLTWTRDSNTRDLNAKNVKKEVWVNYFIRERSRTILKDITLDGVDADVKKRIIDKMVNKIGQPLNLLAVQNDLTSALNNIQNEGYFFAKFIDTTDNDIVVYSNSHQEALLHIKLDLGQKVYFKDVVVTGNRDTKEYVILRELSLKSGDVITPKILTEFKDRLIALGIFQNIRIFPYVNDDGPATLFVQVNEREFGLLEIIPGFRTDLGAKIGANISYNNLWGANHTMSVNIQANQRFSNDELDSKRSSSKAKLLEYQARVNYTIPYIWQHFFVRPLSLDISTSFQRKRFYAFDANIARLSPTLNYRFNKMLSLGLKYQFEAISQFDASNIKDNDNFTIGGLTPTFSLDFRDSPINPKKGYYLGLSWEFANPYFFSAKDNDLVINFSKFIHRNRLYVPMGKYWVLATSLSWGYQENYAKDYKKDVNGNNILGADGLPVRKGYIPSIKVFRLDGIDTVRGFGDDEINRLEDGPNIGDVTISDRAFFLNFKLEPRYYLSDSMLMGIFFDAGRVYRETFRPLKLRTSVGAGFKFLTPVGSLDFDYGVKLHRDADKEAFGRFHLSIGFF